MGVMGKTILISINSILGNEQNEGIMETYSNVITTI